MRTEPDFRDFLSCLNTRGVNYCIVGGFGVIYHGRPRFTNDLDILVEPSKDNSRKTYEALKDFGADISNIKEDYFKKTGNFYQIGVPPVQIHLLNSIAGVEPGKALKNKVKSNYGNTPAYFIALEDLLQNKKAAGREMDKLDIRVLETVKNKSRKKG